MNTDLSDTLDVPEFELGTKKSPPLFPDYKDSCDDNLLQRDFVWSLAEALPQVSETSDRVGCWTAFNKLDANADTTKSISAGYSRTSRVSCVQALSDGPLLLMAELDIPHIFAHAGERVYARLAHILWKEPELYKNVVILMGGFRQLRVRFRHAL